MIIQIIPSNTVGCKKWIPRLYVAFYYMLFENLCGNQPKLQGQATIRFVLFTIRPLVARFELT